MIAIKGVEINYLDYGEKDKTAIVLLHGWGQNTEMMDMLGKPFHDNYRIINIDLPGFGKSLEPSIPWGINDYVIALEELLKKLKIKDAILIGHSFGGRIAIKYASRNKVKKLVLLGSPFRPNKKKSFKTTIFKILKKISFLKGLENWAKSKFGSRDYRAASEVMRGTLVKVVNENLTEDAKKIKAPTIILFGTLDSEVPLSEAEALEKLIPNAGLIVYEGGTHYAYLERLNQTIAILKEFFK